MSTQWQWSNMMRWREKAWEGGERVEVVRLFFGVLTRASTLDPPHHHMSSMRLLPGQQKHSQSSTISYTPTLPESIDAAHKNHFRKPHWSRRRPDGVVEGSPAITT